MSRRSDTLNVFEALEKICNPQSDQGNEALFGAKVVIFPPDDGSDTDEDEGGDNNCIPDHLCKKQLLAAAEVEFVNTRLQPNSDEPQTSDSGFQQVYVSKFELHLFGYIFILLVIFSNIVLKIVAMSFDKNYRVHF